MKPFVWRPGASNTPIPGREVKRGRRPPRKAARAVAVETYTDKLDIRATDEMELTFEKVRVRMNLMEEMRQKMLSTLLIPAFTFTFTNWRDGSIDTTCSEVAAQALLEGCGA